MIDILMFLPPQAQLSISLDDYKTFLEIAKQDEQQRIIKLLEEDAGDWHEMAKRCEAGFCHCDAIALVKGEK